MEVTFRRMNLEDPAEVLSIAERDILIPSLFDPDLQPMEYSLSDQIEALGKLTADDFADVAVDSSGAVIGWHVIRKNTFFGRAVGNISTLWVDADFRRQGIATEFKIRAERWGKEQKLYCLYTSTFTANVPTVALNKNSGFETISYRMQKKL